MNKLATIHDKLFPSPDETRLVEILGGTTLTIGGIRKGNRPLTFIISQGRLLKSRRFRRMVVDGDGVLANDVQQAILIMGSEYERDVIEAFQRDERLEAEGWSLAHIRAIDLWTNPVAVRRKVITMFA